MAQQQLKHKHPLAPWYSFSRLISGHYLLKAGAEMRSLGDVKWCAIEDGKPGKGIGRYTMAFILRGKKK